MLLEALLIIGAFATKSQGLCLAQEGSSALICENVRSGEFAVKERVSLVKVSKGKSRHLVTLAHRCQRIAADQLRVLGDHVAAEANLVPDAYGVFIDRVERCSAQLLVPCKYKSWTCLFGTGVMGITDRLVGCFLVRPDLFPEEWGNCMPIVSRNKVTWERQPLREEGFSLDAGPSKSSFRLNYPSSTKVPSFASISGRRNAKMANG